MSRSEVVYASDHSASVLSTHKWRTAVNSIPYLLPSLTPTMKILDIGCGPGTITIDLAKLVPQGQVVGVEYTDEPLSQGRALALKEGVENVTWEIGDIHELPFEDNSFDVVHTHQVLQHIRNPVRALEEMKRVAKRGGIVAARESASMTWYPQTESMTKWKDLHIRVSKAKGGNPDPGSWIHVWAKEAGFKSDEIKCSAGTWCYSTKEEREWWSGIFAERVLSSAFARFAVDGGHCTRAELEQISEGWREWGDNEDGWFSILHGEILCRA